jgi:hypothetical protein
MSGEAGLSLSGKPGNYQRFNSGLMRAAGDFIRLTTLFSGGAKVARIGSRHVNVHAFAARRTLGRANFLTTTSGRAGPVSVRAPLMASLIVVQTKSAFTSSASI